MKLEMFINFGIIWVFEVSLGCFRGRGLENSGPWTNPANISRKSVKSKQKITGGHQNYPTSK